MKILITNHFLNGFSGSEILTLDIALAFKRLNYDVTVGTFVCKNPLKLEFDKHSINVINLNAIKEKDFFDIIWSHHFTTIELCLFEKNISARKIIYSSLSPFNFLESPPLSIQEINLLLANSLENKNKLIDMGFSDKDILIFPNPVPESFYHFPTRSITELKKIAVVSNHVPEEIKDSKILFRKNNIDIVFFGADHNYTLVTPNILYEFDAVITIGRTAQYCLSMGIPLYCYDYFGGPGWITKNNIKLSSEFNFSGRCVGTKKSAEEIFYEVNSFFANTLKHIEFYKEFSQREHNLANSITNITNLLEKKGKVIIENTQLIKNIITRQNQFYGTLFTSQLFIDFGSGFSEKNSFSLPISSKNNTISFKLPSQDENIIQNLRFDPLNTPCYLKINKISFTDKNNDHHEIIPPLQTNALFQQNNYYLFDTNDPQILITPKTTDYFKDKIAICFEIEIMLISNKGSRNLSLNQEQEKIDCSTSKYEKLSKELDYIHKMIKLCQYNELKSNLIRAEAQLALIKDLFIE